MATMIGFHLSGCKSISFSSSFSSPDLNSLHSNLSFLSLKPSPQPRKSTVIRMGGGPRTFPGGVSKWQYGKGCKRRNRNSFSRRGYPENARFTRCGNALSLKRRWLSLNDHGNRFRNRRIYSLFVLMSKLRYSLIGFRNPVDSISGLIEMVRNCLRALMICLPLVFFPKGVVHSVKPYGRLSTSVDGSDGEESEIKDEEIGGKFGETGKLRGRRVRKRVGIKGIERREEGKKIENRVSGGKLRNEMTLQNDGRYEIGS